jgi:hypothetical protein
MGIPAKLTTSGGMPTAPRLWKPPGRTVRLIKAHFVR